MKGLCFSKVMIRPFACLPVFSYPTVVCRFSPVTYPITKPNPNGMMNIIGIP